MEEDDQKDGIVRSSSYDGGGACKMLIKLKFPKLGGSGGGSAATSAVDMLGPERSEEEEEASSSKGKGGSIHHMNQGGVKVCQECKKEFSSGKALGGHMRIHAQSNTTAASSSPITNLLKPTKTKTKTKTKTYLDHLTHNNGYGYRNGKFRKERYYMNCLNDAGKPTCYICEKVFPSMKSLYGHMRCHPDRRWRGVLPPPETSTVTVVRTLLPLKPLITHSSPSLSDNDNDNDLISSDEEEEEVEGDRKEFCFSWGCKDQRGRKAIRHDDPDEECDAATELLLLKAGGHSSSMAESDMTARLREIPEFEGTNSNSLTNKDKTDDKSPSPEFLGKRTSTMGLVRKVKTVVEQEIEEPAGPLEFDDKAEGIQDFSDNESDSGIANQQLLIACKYKNKNHCPNKKRKKMKLMMDLELGFPQEACSNPASLPPAATATAADSNKYKCSTCNKCFPSHQALGGHRSSHNKAKATSTDHDEEDEYGGFVVNQAGEIVPKESVFAAAAMALGSSSSSIHQCKICNKMFPTGQALGGHKRCHWIGNPDQQALSSQVTSLGEAAVSQTAATDGGRVAFEFDLNEVPPMIEEEAGSGYANNGYASSSYNSNMGCC